MNKLVYVLFIISIWNVITFVLYAIDKNNAIKKQWRISENTLITCAFFMGGLGAMLGMNILRHKTNHSNFKLLIPLALFINLVIVFCYLNFIGAIDFF